MDRFLPDLIVLAAGTMSSSRNTSKTVSTPKFVSAEPKNTGESFPSELVPNQTRHWHHPKAQYHRASLFMQFITDDARASSGSSSCRRPCVCRPFFVRCLNVQTPWICLVFLSYTPLKSLPEPIGQLIGTCCNSEFVFDFIHQIKRITCFAIHFINKCKNWNMTHHTYFK